MGKLDHDFGIIFWLHLVVIIAFILTPFYLSWFFIFLLLVLHYVQGGLFKNCLLTKAQFGRKNDIDHLEMSFFVYYFKKMGLKANPKKVKKYFAHILLWVVFIFSLLWQIVLDKSLWFFN